MHVLIVPSWYPTTEAPLNGIYFAEQAQCLAERGMQVGIIFPEQQSLRRASWEAVRAKHFQTEWTHDYDLPTLRRYGWNVWWRFPPGIRLRVRSAVRLAPRYVDRYGLPDVIHAQSGRWAGAAAAHISGQYSIPYVLTEHFSGFQRNSIFSWRWPLVKEGYQHASALSAVSNSLKEALVSLDLVHPSDVEITPNLAPASQFSLPPSERSSPPPFRLVTVARLSSRKNIGGLLDTLSALHANDFTLTIVGDGPNRAALEQKTQRLGLSDCVTFRGQLDRESVRSALWNAHAFVLPSHEETFGVVLLEAMATGIPVVATACGGPEDIVAEDTGLLVPTDDVDALAGALQILADRWASFDPREIRARTLEQYGPEPFVRRTRLLYQRAISTA
jgi:glycosyltransferase involved in cell wall biosynthesis